MEPQKSEWYFIINPKAGSGRTMSKWIPAEKKLDSFGIPFTTEYTTHKRHATALAYSAAAEGYRKIAAVGGDGSLHEVFNGIMKWCADYGADTSQFTLGIVPIGSGNDWIKTLGIPSDALEAVELLSAGNTGKMDIVSASFGGKTSYMCNVGGTGFDSRVCRVVNEQKEMGMRSRSIYLKALIRTILNLKPIDIRVTADGSEVFCGQAYSVALGNGRYSGGGMRQVPLARIDDGLLDYTVVPKEPLLKMLKAVPRLFNGTVNELEWIVSGQCRTLEITPLSQSLAEPVEIDGEIEGNLPVTFTVNGTQAGTISR